MDQQVFEKPGEIRERGQGVCVCVCAHLVRIKMTVEQLACRDKEIGDKEQGQTPMGHFKTMITVK